MKLLLTRNRAFWFPIFLCFTILMVICLNFSQNFTMLTSNFLQWRYGSVEDSPQNTTLTTTTSTSTTSSTISTPAPSSPKEMTETVSWDRTLTWENSLNKLKLLKSIGNGKNQSSSISGCNLPKFDPWGEEILKFVDHMWVAQCSPMQEPLMRVEFNKLLVDHRVLDRLELSRDQVDCYYKYIKRVNDDSYTFEEEILMTGSEAELSASYVSLYARCVREEKEIYRNFLMYVPDITNTSQQGKEESSRYSVIILGIESFSQLNLIRTLPSTWRLLKRQGAVLYQGHNRVGLNTYPNVMALLTGEKTEGDPDNESLTKLISLVYRDHGYVTLHMEDSVGMGTFQVPGVGFDKPPADFYYRPFFQAINSANHLRCGQIGTWGNVFQYLQEKKLHKYQFDVLHDFLEKYKTAPTFAFLHLSDYTHNDQNLARLYDDDLSSLLEKLFDSGALDRTFLLLMGDHGFRMDFTWGGTDQGKAEASMPALAVLAPQQFRTQHPDKAQNLVKNTKFLTSNYDAHLMLQDILALSLGKSTKELFAERKTQAGVSLFSEVTNRTCQEAGVPLMYCCCNNSREMLQPDDPTILAIANGVLDDLNLYLSGLDFCQPLTLDSVKKPMLKIDLTSFQLDVKEREAKLEVDLLCDENNYCSVTLSRMDLYSATSHCIPANLKDRIKQFCICSQ